MTRAGRSNVTRTRGAQGGGWRRACSSRRIAERCRCRRGSSTRRSCRAIHQTLLVWSHDARSVRGYSIHTLSTRFCPGKVERRPGQTRAGLCRPACLQSARSPQQREQATHCPRADRGRMREGRPLARLVDEIKSQCTFCSWIVFIMCLDWIQVRAADC